MQTKEHTPYLIEPTRSGAYRVKRGKHRKSLYGGSVRWTLIQECGTLEEAAKLVVRLTIGG